MNSQHGHLASDGLTLIELVVAIAIVAVLLTLAVPSIQDSIKNNRIASQNNELVALISLAKSEAIRRNTEVTLQLSAAGNTWEGLVLDPDGTEAVEGCAVGVLRCAEHDRVALNGPNELTFDNRGYLTNFAQANVLLTHEDCNGTRQRRRIEVLPTGQISSCDRTCTDTSACP